MIEQIKIVFFLNQNKYIEIAGILPQLIEVKINKILYLFQSFVKKPIEQGNYYGKS